MAVNFSVPLSKSLKRVEFVLTAELRKAAIAAGWGKALSYSLTVRVDGKNIYVDYPESLSKQVEDHEYGNMGAGGHLAPTAVIRTFIDKNVDMLQGAIAASSVDALFEMGVLP